MTIAVDLGRKATKPTNARIQKISSEGALVDEEKENPNTSISGPSSARQRNAIEMAFRWCADDCPTLNADFQVI